MQTHPARCSWFKEGVNKLPLFQQVSGLSEKYPYHQHELNTGFVLHHPPARLVPEAFRANIQPRLCLHHQVIQCKPLGIHSLPKPAPCNIRPRRSRCLGSKHLHRTLQEPGAALINQVFTRAPAALQVRLGEVCRGQRPSYL